MITGLAGLEALEPARVDIFSPSEQAAEEGDLDLLGGLVRDDGGSELRRVFPYLDYRRCLLGAELSARLDQREVEQDDPHTALEWALENNLLAQAWPLAGR